MSFDAELNSSASANQSKAKPRASTTQSLILMGNLQPLHVRVNVDEEDLPRLKLYAPARAKIRGDARQEEVPLSFFRLEPYVVPKTSLTGVNTERVDTRVV